jgi:predicted phosphodiesterase
MNGRSAGWRFRPRSPLAYAVWVSSVRIVALADTHSRHHKLKVPEGDVLIHAGDLTQRGTLEQLEAVARWLRGLPHAEKIVVAGNHDFALQRDPERARALFDGLTYLEDEERVVAGLRLWGSPWQPEFFDWAYNLPRGAPLDARWQLIPHGLDVLVTHGPPYGFGDVIYDGSRVGCHDLLRHCREKQPRLHLFGHIHEDRGEWQEGGVRFVNVTTSESALPATVIDLPLR